MISVVICSVNKRLREEVSANIAETIGTEYEIIAIDNSLNPRGICAVYNQGGLRANYDYLCFVHEDVLFRTKNWGQKLIEATQADTGVIGFAGGSVKTAYPSFWGDIPCQYTRINITQLKKGKEKLDMHNPHNERFSRVAVLDGVFLFTRKKVWMECPFDENQFQHFHSYDNDFTFQVAQKYKNYVCFDIDLLHFSKGSFSKEWYIEAKKFNEKWKDQLPFSLDQLTEEEWREIDFKALYVLVKHYLIKKKVCDVELDFYYKQFRKKYPFNKKLLTLVPKYWVKCLVDLFH